MSSSNRRERELARRKRERQLAKAAGKPARNQNALIYVVVAVVVAVVGWSMISSASAPDASPTTSSPAPSITPCAQAAPTPVASPVQFDSPGNKAISGQYLWTLKTNCGDIVVALNGDKAPATVRSFKFLSDKHWLDNVLCHRLTTTGLFVLQCGDPTATGSGGPGYTIPDENLPKSEANNYPAGTVAMANAGAGTGGSQFFIVFADTTLDGNYTIFGTVRDGLDVVQRIAADGVADGSGDGAPANPIGILSSTVVKDK